MGGRKGIGLREWDSPFHANQLPERPHPLVFGSASSPFYANELPERQHPLCLWLSILCSGLKMMELELHEQQICLSLFLSPYMYIYKIPCLPQYALHSGYCRSKHTPDEHERPRCKNRQRTMSKGLISTLM